jgi:chemotaxis protein CheX
MDTRIRNAVVRSTQNAFQTMVSMEVCAGEAPAGVGREFDFTGIVGVCGRVSGAVAVHLPRSLAMSVGSTVLGIPMTEDSPDLVSLVGELSNLVAGGVKTQLVKELGFEFEISIPTVMTGRLLEVAMMVNTPTVAVLFSDPAGPDRRFLVEAKLLIR